MLNVGGIRGFLFQNASSPDEFIAVVYMAVNAGWRFDAVDIAKLGDRQDPPIKRRERRQWRETGAEWRKKIAAELGFVTCARTCPSRQSDGKPRR